MALLAQLGRAIPLAALLSVTAAMAAPLVSVPALAADPPAAACAAASGLLAYPPKGAPPALTVVDDPSTMKAWQPPACLGWSARPTALLLALAARPTTARLADIEQRLVAVSKLADIRYWSRSRQTWRHLLDKAVALAGPDPASETADPPIAALLPGATLYSLQDDNDALGPIVVAMRVRERTARRLVVTYSNRTAGRVMGLTILPPDSVETALVIEDGNPSTTFLAISRIGSDAQTWLLPAPPSQLNRAVALYRYLIGMPTDTEPPYAP